MVIGVEAQDQGKRVDKFLAEQLSSLSRSEIQKLISRGEVTVDKKEVSCSRKLKEGETVEAFSETQLQEKQEQEWGEQKEIFPRIEIIVETSDYIVLNKPAGLIVHRAPHIKEVSLADFLLEKYPEIDQVGEDGWRPGLVHRLDREVSGLMVVARTNDFFQKLKEQFQNRRVEKWYTALVHGQVDKDEDVIDLPIKRSDKGFRMAAVPHTSLEADKARPARTYWQLEQQTDNFSLLKVKIETGRTHQIRTHLFAYGYPVVGDKLYSNKRIHKLNQKAWEKGFPENRIFLVASRLQFRDEADQKRDFQVKLPAELKDLVL